MDGSLGVKQHGRLRVDFLLAVGAPGQDSHAVPLLRAPSGRTLGVSEVPMRTRVEKCPGGLAVVVPEPLAAQAGLRTACRPSWSWPTGGWSCGPAARRRSPNCWPASRLRTCTRSGPTVRPPGRNCCEPGVPGGARPRPSVWLSLDPQSGHEQAGVGRRWCSRRRRTMGRWAWPCSAR